MKPLRNKLPDRENLVKKKIYKNNLCHLCGKLNKIAEHMLLMCQFACIIWYESPVSFIIDENIQLSSTSRWKSWMEKKIEGLVDEENVIHMSFMLRYI